MQAWTRFYSVMGAAAATLIGLLFVAVSINASTALKKGPDGSRRIAEQAFENYLAVLAVSLLALMPDVSLTSFGRITLALTASWSVWVLVRFYQAASEPSVHETRFTAIRRHLPTLIGFGLLISSAGQMGLFGAEARTTLGAANMVLLFSATERAWTLFTRLAGAK